MNKYCFLGNNELPILRLGLGCMGMSEFYGKTDDKESIKTLYRAYELGVNHFDTADVYGIKGHNEILLGQAIKSFDRSRIIVATKCGFVKDENNTILGINGTPEYIKKSCEASLQRLGVDYIDLFYLHRADPNTSIEASMQALSELVKEGKILNIGLSAVGPDTILRAHRIHKLAAVQSEYSIWTRDAEFDVLSLCKNLGIIFVAYSPIASGFLTGKLKSIDELDQNDLRRVVPRLQKENIGHNLYIVEKLNNIANLKGCTTVQVALAWLLAQGDHIMAIPGTKRVGYLEENIGALNVKLSEDELDQLSRDIPFKFTKGDKYPPEFLKILNNYEIKI